MTRHFFHIIIFIAVTVLSCEDTASLNNKTEYLHALQTSNNAGALYGETSLSPININNAKNFFSLIVLPDTQVYAMNYPDIFQAQMKWIRKNADGLNIAAVIHEGDITSNNNDPEWKVAKSAFNQIDRTVPYILAAGNHDLWGYNCSPSQPRGSRFNNYFTQKEYNEKPWYADHYHGSGNENAQYYFNAGNLQFMVITLDFGAPDEVLAWADAAVSANEDKRTIIVTHCYMNFNNRRVGPGDAYNPHLFDYDANDGEEIWNKFVKKHNNIFLVVSGHVVGNCASRLTSIGEKGNEIHQVLANYQMLNHGGDGWLRIILFMPDANEIVFLTYSPYLKRYLVDNNNYFTIYYNQSDYISKAPIQDYLF